jgi:hypothetical protein
MSEQEKVHHRVLTIGQGVQYTDEQVRGGAVHRGADKTGYSKKMSNKTGFSTKMCRQNGVQCKVEQTRDRGQYTDEQKRGGTVHRGTYQEGHSTQISRIVGVHSKVQ